MRRKRRRRRRNEGMKVPADGEVHSAKYASELTGAGLTGTKPTPQARPTTYPLGWASLANSLMRIRSNSAANRCS
eukprot:8370110-Pyramimonas_sp.AAC.2